MKNVILFLVVEMISFGCINKSVTHDIKISKLAPDIYLLDKDKPIKSLAELTAFFKNRTAYIDRWATWCSPCIEEFKYGDSLHKFLNDNKIEMIYLNSDKDIQDSILYQFIISHNLKGFHLRLNDSLKMDLTGHKIFIPAIPQFMIMDKNGKVVENNALRPSKGDTLFVQLKKYANN
jgi:thiol-disulfide isomerase/thioredoxin